MRICGLSVKLILGKINFPSLVHEKEWVEGFRIGWEF